MWKAIVASFGVGHVCAEISLKIKIESGRWLKRDKSGTLDGTIFAVDPLNKAIRSDVTKLSRGPIESALRDVSAVVSSMDPNDMQVVAAARFKPQTQNGEDLKNSVEETLELVADGASIPVVSPGVVVAPKDCQVSRKTSSFLCLPVFRRSYLRIECQGNDGPVVFRIYEKLPLSRAIRQKTLYHNTMVLYTKTEIAGGRPKQIHITAVTDGFFGLEDGQNGIRAVQLSAAIYKRKDGNDQTTLTATSVKHTLSLENLRKDFVLVASRGTAVTGGAGEVPFLAVRADKLTINDLQKAAAPKDYKFEPRGKPVERFESSGPPNQQVTIFVGGPTGSLTPLSSPRRGSLRANEGTPLLGDH